MYEGRKDSKPTSSRCAREAMRTSAPHSQHMCQNRDRWQQVYLAHAHSFSRAFLLSWTHSHSTHKSKQNSKHTNAAQHTDLMHSVKPAWRLGVTIDPAPSTQTQTAPRTAQPRWHPGWPTHVLTTDLLSGSMALLSGKLQLAVSKEKIRFLVVVSPIAKIASPRFTTDTIAFPNGCQTSLSAAFPSAVSSPSPPTDLGLVGDVGRPLTFSNVDAVANINSLHLVGGARGMAVPNKDVGDLTASVGGVNAPPATPIIHINSGLNVLSLDSRRVLHPAPEGAGMQNTSQITMLGAILKKKGERCYNVTVIDWPVLPLLCDLAGDLGVAPNIGLAGNVVAVAGTPKDGAAVVVAAGAPKEGVVVVAVAPKEGDTVAAGLAPKEGDTVAAGLAPKEGDTVAAGLAPNMPPNGLAPNPVGAPKEGAAVVAGASSSIGLAGVSKDCW